MKKAIQWFIAVLMSGFGVCSSAQTVDDMKALVAGMKQGGYVIVFRHGATNRDQADTDPLNHDNIARQRLLSEKGKEVARQVGDAFKLLDIPLGEVIMDAFGKDWFDAKEGEASVFRPEGSGKVILVARVQPTDWITAASGK